MRSFTRLALLNLALYAPAVALLAVAAVALLLGAGAASIAASLSGAAWLVAAYAAMWLFEPALRRWANAAGD